MPRDPHKTFFHSAYFNTVAVHDSLYNISLGKRNACKRSLGRVLPAYCSLESEVGTGSNGNIGSKSGSATTALIANFCLKMTIVRSGEKLVGGNYYLIFAGFSHSKVEGAVYCGVSAHVTLL